MMGAQVAMVASWGWSEPGSLSLKRPGNQRGGRENRARPGAGDHPCGECGAWWRRALALPMGCAEKEGRRAFWPEKKRASAGQRVPTRRTPGPRGAEYSGKETARAARPPGRA